MSNNDLEVYGGGDIQPYSPDSPLAPSPADNWGVEPDYAYERQQHQTTPVRLFGEVLPPGATAEHVQQAIGQIAGVFLSDFSILGHNQSHIQAAISWLQSAATRPPQQEAKRNDFPLFQYEGDPMAIAFSNAMYRAGAPAKFVSDALWWITELEKQIGSYGSGHDQAPAMDGNPTSIDQLSESQYERVVQLNAQLQLRTMDTLSRKWGRHMVHANIALAQKYLDSLPEADQRHFDQYLQDWTHNLNHAETLEFLYGQAIGAGSLPTSSAGIVQEIAQIESVMGTAAYRKDERMQARYRELVTIRDRGR